MSQPVSVVKRFIPYASSEPLQSSAIGESKIVFRAIREFTTMNRAPPPAMAWTPPPVPPFSSWSWSASLSTTVLLYRPVMPPPRTPPPSINA